VRCVPFLVSEICHCSCEDLYLTSHERRDPQRCLRLPFRLILASVPCRALLLACPLMRPSFRTSLPLSVVISVCYHYETNTFFSSFSFVNQLLLFGTFFPMQTSKGADHEPHLGDFSQPSVGCCYKNTPVPRLLTQSPSSHSTWIKNSKAAEMTVPHH